MLPPALLALQQLPVGRDLDVQGQLDVHQLLVLTELSGHVSFGFLQGIFQVNHLCLGIFEGQLPTLLGVSNGRLQGGTLYEEGLGLLNAAFFLGKSHPRKKITLTGVLINNSGD